MITVFVCSSVCERKEGRSPLNKTRPSWVHAEPASQIVRTSNLAPTCLHPAVRVALLLFLGDVAKTWGSPVLTKHSTHLQEVSLTLWLRIFIFHSPVEMISTPDLILLGQHKGNGFLLFCCYLLLTLFSPLVASNKKREMPFTWQVWGEIGFTGMHAQGFWTDCLCSDLRS